MMFVKLASVATSQSTTTSCCASIPPPFRGSGASRVHRTTPSGNGSPEATPSVKGLPRVKGYSESGTVLYCLLLPLRQPPGGLLVRQYISYLGTRNSAFWPKLAQELAL